MDTANYRHLSKFSASLKRRSSWKVCLILIAFASSTKAIAYDHLKYDASDSNPSTEKIEVTEDSTIFEITFLPDTTESTESVEDTVSTSLPTTTDPQNDRNDFYCREDLCLQYDLSGQLVQKKHVACGHDGSFAESCLPGRTLFKIDSQIEAFIIHLHNEARNRLANGSLEGFEAAFRMPTVMWNDELATLAELNVKSCQFKHDECRNTDLYRQAGQNLALGYYPIDENIFDIIQKLTSLWFNEYKDADQKVMDDFVNPANVTIGHFTQMMSDRTTAIGCGIVIYPQKVSGYTFKVVLYACNYSITSIYSQPVYRKGQMGAKCVSGMNPHYNGLCSMEENHSIHSVPFYE
ncbi:antigen 5 like allergen Cul n 1-like isoform X2 [Malaya genurostris]|uniref:antigen 5 like allergen Cul n 1-like isoform X2 n=1 Tax=Malaya genurostris TaxID=325434 RepID=UPI0026F3F4D8|nr:antigen 5 like allergen Cul n 1-like isoform X2 [Malaya genurostris]